VAVSVGVSDRVNVLVGVLVGVNEGVEIFVGDRVVVGVVVGLDVQIEFAALGLPRIEKPSASSPLIVIPLFVLHAVGLSGMIPILSIDAWVSDSPAGQLPPEILAVSTVSPDGPSRYRVSPPFPRAPV